MSDTWTNKRLLDWAASYLQEKGLPTPRLDAELLLSDVQKCERIRLYADFDKVLLPDELQAFREKLLRRKAFEPVAYIIGRKEFYSLSFEVSNDVLIPRPETEELVQCVLEYGIQGKSVLDIGTGSGCIAVALSRYSESADISGIDISKAAVAAARKNSIALLGRDIGFSENSIVLFQKQGPLYDVLVSNPPYVSDAEYDNLPPNVREFEPSIALKAGSDGMDVIRGIYSRLSVLLREGGALFLEIGKGQGTLVKTLMQDAFEDVEIKKDLAGLDRMVICRGRRHLPPEQKA